MRLNMITIKTASVEQLEKKAWNFQNMFSTKPISKIAPEDVEDLKDELKGLIETQIKQKVQTLQFAKLGPFAKDRIKSEVIGFAKNYLKSIDSQAKEGLGLSELFNQFKMQLDLFLKKNHYI